MTVNSLVLMLCFNQTIRSWQTDSMRSHHFYSTILKNLLCLLFECLILLLAKLLDTKLQDQIEMRQYTWLLTKNQFVGKDWIKRSFILFCCEIHHSSRRLILHQRTHVTEDECRQVRLASACKFVNAKRAWCSIIFSQV